MSKDTKLTIVIGPPLTLDLTAAGGLALIISAIVAIPAFNELVLNGHWSINIFGGLSKACLQVLRRCLVPRIRPSGSLRLPTRPRWVQSEEWRA